MGVIANTNGILDNPVTQRTGSAAFEVFEVGGNNGVIGYSNGNIINLNGTVAVVGAVTVVPATIRGDADAEATEIYARAYGRDVTFYTFMKSLETYEQSLDSKSTLILTTDSDLLRYLKNTP